MSGAPLPERVLRASELARVNGFAGCSRPEVGRLLRVLAAASGGRVGEVGTGIGYGAAWLLSGLGPGGRLVTVETDAERAAMARSVLDDPRAAVLHGGVDLLVEHGPFDLLFVDAPVKATGPDGVLHLLRKGGVVVLDDFTPSTSWPPLQDGAPDTLRLAWLTHEGLACEEIEVSVDHSVLVGVRMA